jgi:multiple sugar transport system permease protein
MTFITRQRSSWTARSRQERLGLRLLLPVLGIVVAITTLPFVMAVLRAVTTDTGQFVGLDNFAHALENGQLVDAVKQTAVYGAIVLPAEILLGLGLALLVHREVRSPGIRAAIYVAAMIPIVIPQIAVGVVFRLVYGPDYGVINAVLGLQGHDQILWLSQPTLAMISVASVDIWQWTPFVYLVLFAGLQTVPKESIEAAQVDGATWWTQFRYIELHYLRPLFLLILFFRVADVLRVFDHVFILTGGGPGTSTQLLSLYMYRIEFKFFDGGQAAALAVLVLVAISVLYSLVTRALPLERA